MRLVVTAFKSLMNGKLISMNCLLFNTELLNSFTLLDTVRSRHLEEIRSVASPEMRLQ